MVTDIKLASRPGLQFPSAAETFTVFSVEKFIHLIFFKSNGKRTQDAHSVVTSENSTFTRKKTKYKTITEIIHTINSISPTIESRGHQTDRPRLTNIDNNNNTIEQVSPFRIMYKTLEAIRHIYYPHIKASEIPH